jgi:AcrR family transcriptional regulator
MAVYWYYPSKDALLDATAGLLVNRLRPLDPKTVEGGDYIDALRQIAHGYRRLALSSPHAFQLLTTRRPVTPGIHRVLDEYVGCAEAQGLDSRTIARYYRLVAGFCSGSCSYELATLDAKRRAASGSFGVVAPRVAKVLAWLTAEHAEDMFSFAREHLLTSLEAAAPKSRRRSGGKRVR